MSLECLVEALRLQGEGAGVVVLLTMHQQQRPLDLVGSHEGAAAVKGAGGMRGSMEVQGAAMNGLQR